MAKTRRAYTAPPDDARCTADRKPLKDGSGARCMRRQTGSDSKLCAQHERIAAERGDLDYLCGLQREI